MTARLARKGEGFTLIELLIVVAIIAILAAIAVPNFIEARARAKVSRAKADMRSLATALEAYAVDTNNYPPVHYDASRPAHPHTYCNYLFRYDERGSSFTILPWLSTPIAYITEYPIQAFTPRRMVNQGQQGFLNSSYFLINFKGAKSDPDFIEGNDLVLGSGQRELESPMPINVIGGGYSGIKNYSDWILFGIGPSGVIDLDNPDTSGIPNQYGEGTAAIQMTFTRNEGQPGGTYLEGWRTGWWKQYDPTNGTVSLGFIFRLQNGIPNQ